jgi:hypothetical protein
MNMFTHLLYCIIPCACQLLTTQILGDIWPVPSGIHPHADKLTSREFGELVSSWSFIQLFGPVLQTPKTTLSELIDMIVSSGIRMASILI